MTTATPSTITREVPLGPGRVYAAVDPGCRRSMVLLGTVTASAITMLVPEPVMNTPTKQSYTFPIQSTSLTTDGEHMLREMAEEFRRQEAATPIRNIPKGRFGFSPATTPAPTDERLVPETTLLAEEQLRQEAVERAETRKVSYRQQQRELPRFLRKRGRG